MTVEREVAADDPARERPPRLDDGPGERREHKAEADERDGIALADTALGNEEVERVRHCSGEGRSDAGGVEAEPAPDLDDEREAGDRKGERRPDPLADGLAEDEPGPQRD